MTSKSTLPAIAAPVLLVALIAAIYVPAIMTAGVFAWDDGAITLAIAKTLAGHGVFALTPGSPVAEGSSSLLLTFIFAGLFKVLPLSFSQAVTMSQLVSLGFLIATVLYAWRLLGRVIANPFARALAAAPIALLPMALNEVMNGMEMTLFAFLLLVYADAFTRRSKLAFFILPLVLLTRFEAIFYVCFALGSLFLFDADRNRRILIAKHITLALGVFAALTVTRLLYFGDYLPNTIVAKMNPPYSAHGLQMVKAKLGGGAEFLFVNAAYLIALAVLGWRLGWRQVVKDFCIWLAVAFLIFAFVSGRNWGYAGRMFLGLLPLLVLCCADWARRVLDAGPAPTSQRRVILVVAGVFAASFIVDIPVGLAAAKTLKEAHAYAKLEAAGVDKQGRPFHYGEYGVSPRNVRIPADAVAKLAEAIGAPRITFAVPDVGGVGLCCEQIVVLDTALLTNPDLSRKGYGYFDTQLRQMKPEVVATYGIWSRASDIYASPFFVESYRPLVLRNTLLWVRNDIYDRLATKAGDRIITGPVESPGQIRYLVDPDDYAFLQRRGYTTLPRLEL